jgi:hypothetical protein
MATLKAIILVPRTLRSVGWDARQAAKHNDHRHDERA